jgi:hypothetical protein
MYWRQVFCFRLKPESKQDKEQHLDENIYVSLCEPRSYNTTCDNKHNQANIWIEKVNLKIKFGFKSDSHLHSSILGFRQ